MKMADSALAKFLFCLFKCLGLAPLTFSREKNFSVSTCGLIYNVALMTFLVGASSFCVKFEMELSADYPVIQYDRMIDNAYVTIGATSSFFILAHFCANRNKVASIANRLATLYESFAGRETNLLTTIFKKACFASFFAWFPLLLVVVAEIALALKMILYFVVPFTCDTIVFVIIFQYSLLLNFAKRLFRRVNEDIVGELSPDRLQVKITKLSRLRELHLTLCEICEELNRFYSKPMLLGIFYLFVKIVFSSYFIVKGLLFEKRQTTEFIVPYVLAECLHALATIHVLTRSTTGVVNESKRTGKIVNNCMGFVADEQLTVKLIQFSIHLLHQHLQFSACGLFALDGTLMMSIISSITTYMVILLQFQH